MDPFPGSLPKEPIISTPTNTSPFGKTARQAGLGTISGPAIFTISKEVLSVLTVLGSNPAGE